MSDGTTELTRAVPLYMQVVRQLRAQIASGEIAEGDVLPSQRQMMQRWKISMQTASKIIGALKTEGIAIPTAGRDTIVAPGAAARIASAAAAGTLHADRAEVQADARGEITAAEAGRVAAPRAVEEILGIPSGRRALRRAETRSADGRPVGLTVAWYPPQIVERAPRLEESQPLPSGAVAYIAEAAGVRVRRAEEQYSAEAADDDTAATLGIEANAPVLVVRSRLYDTGGELIEYAETSVPAGRTYARNYTSIGS